MPLFDIHLLYENQLEQGDLPCIAHTVWAIVTKFALVELTVCNPPTACFSQQAKRNHLRGRYRYMCTWGDSILLHPCSSKKFLQLGRYLHVQPLICWSLSTLTLCCCRYVDCTFREPFQQLFYVHGFVKNSGQLKQPALGIWRNCNIACILYGACMAPNCLWDTSALLPNCLHTLWRGRIVSQTLRHQFQTVLGPKCLGSNLSEWVSE